MDADALDYLAITRLQAAYADVVTRRAWRELERLFLPDAHDDVAVLAVRLDRAI